MKAYVAVPIAAGLGPGRITTVGIFVVALILASGVSRLVSQGVKRPTLATILSVLAFIFVFFWTPLLLGTFFRSICDCP